MKAVQDVTTEFIQEIILLKQTKKKQYRNSSKRFRENSH